MAKVRSRMGEPVTVGAMQSGLRYTAQPGEVIFVKVEDVAQLTQQGFEAV